MALKKRQSQMTTRRTQAEAKRHRCRQMRANMLGRHGLHFATGAQTKGAPLAAKLFDPQRLLHHDPRDLDDMFRSEATATPETLMASPTASL